MKSRLLVFCLVSFCYSVLHAQTKPAAPALPKNINITLTPLKNCKIYLGSNYGKSQVIADSALLDATGKGAFKGKTKLTPGIYFVVSPNYTIQFEILVGKNQNFSIKGDTTQKDKVVITGSADNDLFKQYSAFTTERGQKLNLLTQQLAVARNKADSSNIQKQMATLNNEIQQYRNKIIKENKSSLLATLLAAMRRPEVPAIPVINGKADSTYPYRFVKEHYWDDVAFNDNSLLRTPFFEPKLDDYYKYYVSPEPDSIIKEVNYMLLFARTGKEIYPYLLTKFTNKYMNPEYMGQDKVFLFLFENFYLKGDTTYLTAAGRKTVTERAYSMMANQVGNPAAPLDLVDTTGKTNALYDLKGAFTVVIFWDPTCGHCKEELPRVDSIYKAKWKALDVKLYAVNIHENYMKELKQFVADKHFSTDWVHVYQTDAALKAEQQAGKPNYRQLYDVSKTPTMYLLDSEKRIIGKQLSIEQFDDLIAAKLKQKNSGK
ncbi:MAG: hypothetical protein C0459_06225 [Chitinophaga sp.]|jgi:thiol-disulfide isomerase/thioredoxin|nr:hypothetical protein [Chitinophaga sp.]